MNFNQMSRMLYKAARLSRDVKAVSQGPRAIGKRLVRREVYKESNRLTAQFLRAIFGGK